MSATVSAKTPEHPQAELKRELTLGNLVLTQILYVVGLSWVGAAAELGSSHVVFWLLAMVLFYIPSAMVVIHLSRKMPLEGGLYEWARLGFGARIGFLTGWNLWVYAIVLMAESGLLAATSIAYAWGPRASWLAESKWLIAGCGALIVGGMALLSLVGLKAGKWLHAAGGATLLVVFAAMLALQPLHAARGEHPMTPLFSLAPPALTLLNLNILGKLGFGALGGFEYVAIFAGECRDPARIIGRSVLISAPIIAAMFILGTASVLWFIPPNHIDLISPVSQVLAVGGRPFGAAAGLASATIMAALGTRIAQSSITFSATARLPMVAGWDRLLPAWFARLHPVYRTPSHAIFMVAAMTFTFCLAGIAGTGSQEAMQLLNNTAGIFYALTYLVMFALPLANRAAGWKLRAAAASGLVMTALYVSLSIFPIIPVGNRALFVAKVGGVVVAGNVAGWLLYELHRRELNRRRLAAAAQ